jgi:citrate lyase beta subunit/ferredoxin
MQTELAEFIRDTPEGLEADAILRKCVHCGFCTATCPTYQLLGDELDGPRGRIYLIKQVLEGRVVSGLTLSHLDRCLTCRSCETTCPSGVRYGRLVDIGREVVEHRVVRPVRDRLTRRALRWLLPDRRRFGPLLALGQALRGVLPASLARRVPSAEAARPWPTPRHPRRLLALEGCVQNAIAPSIDADLAGLLDAIGLSLVRVPATGCCGAVSQHLAAREESCEQMRRNIDAWWPHVEAGAEAIVVSASACALTVKEYPDVLAHDRCRGIAAGSRGIRAHPGARVAPVLRLRRNLFRTPARAVRAPARGQAPGAAGIRPRAHRHGEHRLPAAPQERHDAPRPPLGTATRGEGVNTRASGPRPRRSVLFMPGSNVRALTKARTLPADALILDLEDAVAPNAKAESREHVREAVLQGGYGRRELLVRVNGQTSRWWAQDIEAVATLPVDGVVLPKVEGPDDVTGAAAALDRASGRLDLPLWAMIETPRGVLAAEAIAAASPRLACLVMGTSDLTKEIRGRHTPDRAALVPALSHCVLAARAHGLDILDGVHLELTDEAGLRAICDQGRTLGFDGKTVIHPSQIGPSNEAFGPSPEDTAQAEAVVAAWESARREGRGVVVVEGRLVEVLHAQEAERTLALARAIADG